MSVERLCTYQMARYAKQAISSSARGLGLQASGRALNPGRRFFG
jgi:hypothetical protein